MSNVRVFGGTGRIQLGSGVADSGWGTMLGVLKKDADPTSNMDWFTRGNATPMSLDENIFIRSNHGSLPNGMGYSNSAPATVTTTTTLTAANGWAIIALTKTNGTTTPRIHRCVLSGPTWTHADMSGSLANPTGGTRWWIGCFFSGTGLSPFDGTIALTAYWDAQALADATLEGITSLATLISAAPTGLWVLDQAVVTTPVTEYNGTGADELTRTGTSVVSDTVTNFDMSYPAVVYPDTEWLSFI